MKLSELRNIKKKEYTTDTTLVLAAAEIMIEVYLAESVILKAEKLAKMTSEKEAETQIAMAQLNLFNAVEKSSNMGKEAILYFSEGDEQRMLLMGLKRFTQDVNQRNPIQLRNKIAAKVIAENKYCF